ncbi:PE-PGRS family protein [Streptomyces mexicanus]|uniref:PE-PGRS family protein n=1 Tax=Streptomyces mexicanus TaxID=178566 RepID=A0A7X1LPW0_9ACTN|nr:PE-PGRS family protein [Streptomyces mexicanus]MBC2865298.1 PE-PGRS family protein [Streptomyces mexicanus]
MNRTALGLAVGAGYLVGRTRKLKAAVAVGSLVAGKKLNLSPRAVAELVNRQLKDNPQVKELGDQLRQDLRGAGKAASGAMVERQMTALADRLHDRTSRVRDQLSGAVPAGGGKGAEDRGDDNGGSGESGKKGRSGANQDEYEDREGREAEEEAESEEDGEPGARGPGKKATAKKAAKKAPSLGPAKKAAKKATAQQAPAKKAAKKAPAGKTAAKKTAGRDAAAKKTTEAGGAARAARSRLPKGGGDR